MVVHIVPMMEQSSLSCARMELTAQLDPLLQLHAILATTALLTHRLRFNVQVDTTAQAEVSGCTSAETVPTALQHQLSQHNVLLDHTVQE